MRRQEREVDRPDRAGTCESRDHAVPQIVIEHVANEKCERRVAGGQHEAPMLRDALLLDEHVRDEQQDAAGGVKRGVDCREGLSEGHRLMISNVLYFAATSM